MTATSRQVKAFAAVCDCIDDATYAPESVYVLDGLAARMARHVGLEAGDWCRHGYPLTGRILRRIQRLARQLGLDLPQRVRDAIAHRAEERRWFWVTNKATGERIGVKAHWAEASDSIEGRRDGGEPFVTPFQVADARHNPFSGAMLVARWGG